MTIADRSKYKGVKADWHDKKAAKRETCQAGGGEPWYKLRRHFPNRETAQKAAEAKFKKLKRGEGGLDLAMPGEPGSRRRPAWCWQAFGRGLTATGWSSP